MRGELGRVDIVVVSSFKNVIRSIINAVSNRHRINDSTLYKAYIRVVHPGYAKKKLAEKRFYQDLLSQTEASVVFDVGANVGSKAAIFLEVARKVVCVEPTPRTARILQDRFRDKANIIVLAKGISSRSGFAALHIFNDADNLNTFSPYWVDALKPSDRSFGDAASVATDIINVPTTTLDELIREYGLPCYVKLDVEGYELEALKGLSVKVPIISIEANLPVFSTQTIECLARLGNQWPEARFNYVSEDPPTSFVNSKWVTASEIQAIVRNSQARYMEIYCTTEMSPSV